MSGASLLPYLPTLGRLALALAIGLFVGLERERRSKEAGLRTFAFASLLGCVGGLLGAQFGVLALALVGVLVALLNVDTIRRGEGAELTTSAALLVTAFAGLLAGQGQTFTPTTIGVATAALLAWKYPLAGFSHALTEAELRSAILLAILAFIVYPVLPAGPVDPWGLIEPRAAWVTVILIAALGFANYVLLKVYGARGIEVTGFLGGLVNSTVTVTELAHRTRRSAGRLADAAYRGVVLALVAMAVRNGVILGLLAPRALLDAAVPLALMLAAPAAAAWLWHRRGRSPREVGAAESEAADPPASGGETPLAGLGSPFSLSAALKFGAILLALQVAGALAQRALGNLGLYGVSVLGGLVSSASAVASAANLAASGAVSAPVAAVGAVLASMTSALVHWPIVARISRDRRLARRVGWVLGAAVVLAAAGIAAQAALSASGRWPRLDALPLGLPLGKP